MLHSFLIKECHDALDKHAFTGMLIADSSSAFSSIDHELLFTKLEIESIKFTHKFSSLLFIC